MSLGSRLRTSLLAASLLVPIAAHADAPPAVTADEAQQLQAQFRTWLTTLLGPDVPLGDHAVTFTPDGDHYRVSIAIAGTYGSDVTVTGDPVTASIKPLDGNRWAIDALALPSPLRIEDPSATGDKLRSVSTKIAEQTAQGVLDLSFATTSSLDQMVRGYSSITEMPAGRSQTTHIDRYTSHSSLQPTGDGHLDVTGNGHADTVTTSGTGKDGKPFAVNAGAVDVKVRADKVSPDQIGVVVRALTAMIPAANAIAAAKEASPPTTGTTTQPAAKARGVPPEMRKPLRDLVLAARDSMSGFAEEYTVSDIDVTFGDVKGSAAKFGAGLGLAAPDGKIDLTMLFGLDGLDSPAIPPGPLKDYVPRRIVLKPHLSGIPSQDFVQFLLHAIDSDGTNQDALKAEAIGLLAKGPISLGIDELSFDAGPSSLQATGAVSIAPSADLSAEAQIRVTAYDTLLQQANTIPQLKSAAAIMMFLKGIGKQDGDAERWDIAYQANKLTVNGTDLSALIPSGGAGAPKK